jgi:hypothetical protein
MKGQDRKKENQFEGRRKARVQPSLHYDTHLGQRESEDDIVDLAFNLLLQGSKGLKNASGLSQELDLSPS